MMFEIRESVFPEPVRIFAKPDSIFEPGMVAQLYRCEGDIVCGLSDGTRPIGLFADYKLSKYELLNMNDMIRVWTSRCVFRTDRYQLNVEMPYREGCALYVNSSGFLTSDKPYDSALVIARMITPGTDKYPVLEALYL